MASHTKPQQAKQGRMLKAAAVLGWAKFCQSSDGLETVKLWSLGSARFQSFPSCVLLKNLELKHPASSRNKQSQPHHAATRCMPTARHECLGPGQ